ncbi:MAG: hypothetical protein AAGI68_16555 [Planctomycetota bacterium]
MGYLELVERGRVIRLGLSESLSWEGDDLAYVRLLSSICPESGVADSDIFVGREQRSRYLLYAAAQRLGARVVFERETAAALA